MNYLSKVFTLVALVAVLAACDDGDDGDRGPQGDAGADGAAGLNSLTRQTDLAVGSAACPTGGVLIESGLDVDASGTLEDSEVTESSTLCAANSEFNFNRVASFLVCSQIDATCDTDEETAAEIVAASADGLTLIYSDSPREEIGFVDITDPTNPVGIATVALSGEPTSVAVTNGFAVVGVNTSSDFINVDGELAVFDIATRALVTSIDLGGQPDSVAASPDGSYVVIAIENERDEDLGDGAPPQLPAGELIIVDSAGDPATWGTRTVDLTGLADLYPTDPEPEYVDINADNLAVVTLQENNHIVVVDITDGSIVSEFSAGAASLTQIDLTEEDPAIISQTETPATPILREPDGVAWINSQLFATADEGDLDGGSRGFTVFNIAGDVVFTSGNSNDHLTARLGHYPDGRSGNKGNEPENAEVGMFGNELLLFINSERSSLIFVYNVADPANPELKQILPAGVGPEGGLAIESRNLLVVASEEDNRGDKIRSVLNIYQYDQTLPSYPTLVSVDRTDGTPNPWSAMSGLAADTSVDYLMYAVEDSFYGSNRIFVMDISQQPAVIIDEITLVDSNDVFAGIDTVAVAAGTAADDPARLDVFDSEDLAALINADKTVNIDPEGIAQASDGGFWVASEGAGTVGDAGRPVNSLNFVFKTDVNGVIEDVVTLPDAINAQQLRFGFEGIAEFDGSAYVAFQRVWSGLGDTNVRIGIYSVADDAWTFLFYPLETPTSQNGGWVGLSDITALGGGEFLVVERDNQGGPDAAIKRLYTFDVTGLSDGDTVTKTLVRDLVPDLQASGGLIAEKVEGSAVTLNGDVYIINDNDGVDDNSGESQLLNLGDIL